MGESFTLNRACAARAAGVNIHGKRVGSALAKRLNLKMCEARLRDVLARRDSSLRERKVNMCCRTFPSSSAKLGFGDRCSRFGGDESSSWEADWELLFLPRPVLGRPIPAQMRQLAIIYLCRLVILRH